MAEEQIAAGEDQVPAPDAAGPKRKPPREAIAEARVRAPTRGNRRLESFLDAVNSDEQVRAWWYMAQVHAERLGMSDHSWVHTQIVLNISLRLLRLLVKAGVEPAVVADHGMKPRDAEVVVAVHDGVPLYVELPTSVELIISHTDPGVQGDRATGGTKPATLETGAEIQVPLFVSTGEKVKVDTRDGRYLGRVNS